MSNEFKTKVDLDITLDGLDNHDVITKSFNLRWNLELEMRQYGIKSFIVTVPDQVIQVDVNMWGDDQDEEKPVLLEIKDVIIEKGNSAENFIPSSLEYSQGKWKLVF